jgi:hypothetical protein
MALTHLLVGRLSLADQRSSKSRIAHVASVSSASDTGRSKDERPVMSAELPLCSATDGSQDPAVADDPAREKQSWQTSLVGLWASRRTALKRPARHMSSETSEIGSFHFA